MALSSIGTNRHKAVKRPYEGIQAYSIYPDSSPADLHDEVVMPSELRRAYQQNDRAMVQAYGFDVATTGETGRVAELMKMYQALTEKGSY